MNSKQREELQRISEAITVNTLPNGVRTIACNISLEEVKHIVDTILSEPIRNCERFNSFFDAADAWCKESLKSANPKPFEEWIFEIEKGNNNEQ